MADEERRDEQRTTEGTPPQTQPGVVTAPPPPPPAPPATGEYPRPGEGRPRPRGGILGGVILVAIGLILLVQQFYPALDIGRLWPIILIVIGLGIIFRRR